MKKFHRLIAALHATACAAILAPGAAGAQDADEVRAYLSALSTGTAAAMAEFLGQYPNSVLPGSALGAQIAAGIGQPTASVGSTGAGSGARSGNDADSRDDAGSRRSADDDGIY